MSCYGKFEVECLVGLVFGGFVCLYCGGMIIQIVILVFVMVVKLLLCIFFMILYLVGVGIFGGVIFGMFGGFFGIGFGFFFVVGIGLVFFVGFVYVLYGLGWFEIVCVGVLYCMLIVLLWLQFCDCLGFGGWFCLFGCQVIDGCMWCVVVNFVIFVLFGFIVLCFFWGFVWLIFILFVLLIDVDVVIGLFGGGGIVVVWVFLVGIFGIVVCFVGMLGFVLLYWMLLLVIVICSKEMEFMECVCMFIVQCEGVVCVVDVECICIECDLYDGVQLWLVFVGMMFGFVQQKIDNDLDVVKEFINEVYIFIKVVIIELCQFVWGIYVFVFDDCGLDVVLLVFVGCLYILVYFDVWMDFLIGLGIYVLIGLLIYVLICLGWEVEVVVYFLIVEFLINVVKYLWVSEVCVMVWFCEGNIFWVWVEDNGIGGVQVQFGGGFDGIVNCIFVVGGIFWFDSL